MGKEPVVSIIVALILAEAAGLIEWSSKGGRLEMRIELRKLNVI